MKRFGLPGNVLFVYLYTCITMLYLEYIITYVVYSRYNIALHLYIQ